MDQAGNDKLLRRRLYLQQYVTSLRKELYGPNGLYSEGDRQLLALLSEFLADADDRALGALSNQRTSNADAAKILSGLKSIMIYQRDVTIALIADEMKELVDLEMEYTAQVMQVEKPSSQGVATMPVAGQNPTGIIAAAFLIFATRLIAEVTQAAASNPNNMVRIVRGTKAQEYRDGLFEWRNVRLIRPNVDLIVNGTASNAVERVFIRSGVKKVIHVATLDFRVCLECAAAEVNGPYEIGTQPRIQLHPNCRCINLPADPGIISERPFVRDSRPVKDIPKDERDGKIGTTKDSMEQFINRMTDAERQEWMGPSRAQLWADGEYDDIRLLVNEITGEPLRLDELPTESNAEEEEEQVEIGADDSIIKPDLTNRIDDITDDEIADIYDYSGPEYRDINAALHDDGSRYSPPEVRKARAFTEGVDSIIERSRTTKDAVFYRGIKSKELFKDAESLDGSVLDHVTLQSTTASEDIGKSFAGVLQFNRKFVESDPSNDWSVLIKINAPKGSPALKISTYSERNEHEQEYVLPSTSNYVVREVTYTGAYKLIEVDLESN